MVVFRHELRHQLSACAAGRMHLSISIDGDHPPNGVFSVGQHIENGIPLGANAECAAAVHAYADINIARNGFDSGGDAGGLHHAGDSAWSQNRLGALIQRVPNCFHL